MTREFGYRPLPRLGTPCKGGGGGEAEACICACALPPWPTPPPPPPSPRTCHWNRRSARGPRLAGWREAGGVGAVKGARVRGNRRREREGARSSARSRPGGGVRGGGRGRGAPARTTWPGGGALGRGRAAGEGRRRGVSERRGRGRAQQLLPEHFLTQQSPSAGRAAPRRL